jgi:hypothetical protein
MPERRIGKCISKSLYSWLRHAVAQLVEELYYNPEGCGVHSKWGHKFFNSQNPSSCTMVLGSTKPLTEMSIRNLPGRGEEARADRCVRLTQPRRPPKFSRSFYANSRLTRLILLERNYCYVNLTCRNSQRMTKHPVTSIRNEWWHH